VTAAPPQATKNNIRADAESQASGPGRRRRHVRAQDADELVTGPSETQILSTATGLLSGSAVKTPQSLLCPLALYTSAEAAAILRVKTSWLQRKAATRKVPFTMLGGCYRFTPAHLAVIVQMHERAPDVDTGATTRLARHSSSRASVVTAAANLPPLMPRPSGGPKRTRNTEPAT
jgi:hypothetical protein